MATVYALLANKSYNSTNKKYVIYTYQTDDDGGLALVDCAFDVIIFRAINSGYPSRAFPKTYAKVDPFGAITSSNEIIMTRTGMGIYEIVPNPSGALARPFDGTELLLVTPEFLSML